MAIASYSSVTYTLDSPPQLNSPLDRTYVTKANTFDEWRQFTNLLADDLTDLSTAVQTLDGIDTATVTFTNKTLTSPAITTPTITGNTTFSDGAFDFNIASHDGSNGLKLAGTLVSSSAAELNKLDGATVTTAEINIIDGDTSATGTTVAAADRVVYNDAGTMKQVAVTDLDTFFSGTTKTLTNKTLTSPVLNTPTITGDTTFSDGTHDLDIASHDGSNGLKLGGTLVTSSAAELNKLDGANVTTAEINIIDGGTSASSITPADADRVVYNDAGTMKQVALSTLDTHFSATTKTLTNKTLTSPTIGGTLTLNASALAGTAIFSAADSPGSSMPENDEKIPTCDAVFDFVQNQLAPGGVSTLTVANFAGSAIQTASEVGGDGTSIGDNDTSVLTAAAVINFVEGKGFLTAETGDIQGVTAGVGLSGGGTSGTVALALDFSELTDMTGDISGTTEFVLQDGSTESRKAASEIKLSAFNNDSGFTSNTGDITGVTAGVGLSGGGSSGGVTLTLDMSELTDMTAAVNASEDELILLDNGADRRKLISEIPLSAFNNDSGFTSTNGDITAVTAGDLLDGGGSSGSVTLNVDLSELTDMTGAVDGSADEIVLLDDSVQKRKRFAEIGLSKFDNDLTVLGVTAGAVTASRAVVVDSNKDIGSFRNITLTGELDAGSLDVSGNADIDGTLEADAITVAGTALNTVIAGVTVTNATNATNVTVADESSDTTCFPLFATAASGNLPPKSGTNLTFNSSNGTLAATTFSGVGSFSTFSASGDAAFDTDTLFVDVSADRVGINDSTPSHSLDVNGTARVTGVATFDGNISHNVSGDAGFFPGLMQNTFGLQSEVASTSTNGNSLHIARKDNCPLNLGTSVGTSSTDKVITFNDTDQANGTLGGEDVAKEVGSITITTSATAFNTSSDYRLKENLVGISDGITRVKQLSPKRFNFIVDSGTTVDGFIAHEVSSVVPEAITGAKDATDSNGNPSYQAIDQSKLVPLLTAALQEAITKIESLESRVAALES